MKYRARPPVIALRLRRSRVAVNVHKQLGKGIEYREIGDKIGVSASTACEKVNTVGTNENLFRLVPVNWGPFLESPENFSGLGRPFLIVYILKTKKYIGMKLCMKGNLFVLKICQKNSSVNLRLEIFVMAFRVRKLFGTFEKRAPGTVPEYYLCARARCSSTTSGASARAWARCPN